MDSRYWTEILFHFSIEKLDLSMNMLSEVPKDDLIRISANLIWMSLSMNRLREIPNGISSLQRLRELDLSSNHYITTIAEGIKTILFNMYAFLTETASTCYLNRYAHLLLAWAVKFGTKTFHCPDGWVGTKGQTIKTSNTCIYLFAWFTG